MHKVQALRSACRIERWETCAGTDTTVLWAARWDILDRVPRRGIIRAGTGT